MLSSFMLDVLVAEIGMLLLWLALRLLAVWLMLVFLGYLVLATIDLVRGMRACRR
jgi:hypothetical protein